MASAKSSRSRPAGHSGVFPVGSAAAVGSGGGGGDGGVQLTDKLKIFKTDNFDPDAYVQSKCQTMNEKEIRHLCSYLQDLKKASAEEMRRSVYANYAAFISRCIGVQALKKSWASLSLRPKSSKTREEVREKKDEELEKAKLLSPPQPHWFLWPCQLSSPANCSIRDVRGAVAGQKLLICIEWRGICKARGSTGMGEGEGKRQGGPEERTSKEISDLEGELLSIRNLLNTQAALIHGLSEGVQIDSLTSGPEGSAEDDISKVEDQEPSEIQKWSADFPDMLDVLLAERRVDEALDALDEAERVAVDAKRKQTLTAAEVSALKRSISDNRQRLADQLAEAACQSSTRGIELRAAASALKRLGDGPRAHSLLLSAHNQRLQCNMQTIHPSSTSYGGAYTAALAQQVFSVIAQALSDSVDVFGNESCYASELVTWATKQVMSFALLVKRHVLSSCAAAGGLRAAAECVQISLGHCFLLEARGLSVSSVLLKQFKPSLVQALDANLRRIEESTAALAAADNWILTYPLTGIRPLTRSSAANLALQPKLSSSAHRFNSMVQDFFEDIAPLLSLQLGGSSMDGITQIFNSYVNLLISALPGSMDDEANLDGLGNKIVRMAETEEQQLALLANASLLAEELLPRAAMKLSSINQSMDDLHKRGTDKQNRVPEQREWKRKLQRMVDRLRDNFCRQHALELIFTDEGDTHLSAEMYISMDNTVEEPEWVPSPIFQELYVKLNRMASIAAEMFVGRERFATLLMMRLTETVILWLSEDQAFWEEIEQGAKPLGPLGLQQFYLDMQFVIIFGQGRFLSRHVHQVILDVIDRAMAAFSATGMNPDSVLPADDWFMDVSQEVVSMISGRGRVANGDREVNSPTASVSAHSISSFKSHGSS
ncbi:Exocyst complex component EXO84B [Zea mays]|uniref:Exocyst complex component EXO84B n=1 Tax=Zea mays TaxID=4577 RepID=A0A3L6FPD0_MAIZE|nr:Exocyst complex component EXO84B [Zea mays]